MYGFNDIPDGKQPMSTDAQWVFYNELPASKKKPALDLLKEKITKEDQEKIRIEMAADSDNWYVPYHFRFGMDIRNILRSNGFGEEYWPIWNLDDIYVWLLEDAVKI